MIQVADNFNYRGKKPNFDRDSFDTLQDMKNYSENSLDDGHISYCKETNKHYKFNSNNQSDPTTGKWVEQHEAVPADEEDITEQNGTIQLANKTYDKQSFSGLGRVYLRKNIVGDKNVLTQAMINKANTIYVIQYDYDLKEASINIPENCVLQFDGGSLSNGTTLITGNTLINPQLYLPAVYTNNPNLIVSKGNNHSIFENKSSDPTLNYMQCEDIKATQNAPIIKNTLGEFNRLQIVKTSQQKKQSEALNHYTFDGTSVFDTDNIKPTWVYKETWYDSNGNPAYAEKTGTQYQRPANVKMGFYYFDTSLNKPIWKNSDTENVWIDATGATV